MKISGHMPVNMQSLVVAMPPARTIGETNRALWALGGLGQP